MPAPVLVFRAIATAAPVVMKKSLPLIAAFLAPSLQRQGGKIADAAGDGASSVIRGIGAVFEAGCQRAAHIIRPAEAKDNLSKNPVKPPAP